MENYNIFGLSLLDPLFKTGPLFWTKKKSKRPETMVIFYLKNYFNKLNFHLKHLRLPRKTVRYQSKILSNKKPFLNDSRPRYGPRLLWSTLYSVPITGLTEGPPCLHARLSKLRHTIPVTTYHQTHLRGPRVSFR